MNIENQTHKSAEELALEVQLEEQRTKRLESEAEAARQQKLADDSRRERQEINFRTNLANAVKASGLKTYVTDHDDLYNVLKLSFKFEIKSDGSFDVLDDRNRRIEFGKAFEQFAMQRPHFFDGRSLAPLMKPKAELSKADFQTSAAKAKFIRENSLEAWESMPLRPSPPVNIQTMTARDYNSLPLSERSRLISQYGSEWLADLLLRKR